MDLVNHLEGRLLFAVPKKGRLLQSSLNLLEGCDIQFRREHRLDIALVKNLPIALIFLPAKDIPTFVGEGRVSLGITGRDTVAEHAANVRALRRLRAESGQSSPVKVDPEGDEQIPEGHGQPDQDGEDQLCQEVVDLGFGSCRLQVQVPEKAGRYSKPEDLIGKNVGTSFVRLTEEYFARVESEAAGSAATSGNAPAIGKISRKRLKTKVIELSGSVEAACALGVADGIVDLVESGETMKAAGLKSIDTVVESTATLIKSKNPTHPELVDLITARVRGVITRQKYVLCQYNVHRDKLALTRKITPGKRAPTLTPLDEDDWVAVSAMVEKKTIAIVMDDLTAAGATDILVLDIANTRTA